MQAWLLLLLMVLEKSLLKKLPDPKPNAIPNLTLILTPYGDFFPGEFFPDTFVN